MSDKVTLLFACDDAHKSDSMLLLGSASDRQEAYLLLTGLIERDGTTPLSADDARLFQLIGEGQFHTTELTIGDKL